jgi:hypothetical protein
MKIQLWLVAFALIAIVHGASADDISFQTAPAGRLPPAWTAAKSGKGPGSVWKITEDSSAPGGPKVLAQTSSEGPSSLFNLCIYEKGNHKDPDISVSLKAKAGKWHTLRVVQEGDHIRCYLNGTLYLDVKDDTFHEPGKIGLWTKADAQTEFSDLKVR